MSWNCYLLNRLRENVLGGLSTFSLKTTFWWKLLLKLTTTWPRLFQWARPRWTAISPSARCRQPWFVPPRRLPLETSLHPQPRGLFPEGETRKSSRSSLSWRASSHAPSLAWSRNFSGSAAALWRSQSGGSAIWVSCREAHQHLGGSSISCFVFSFGSNYSAEWMRLPHSINSNVFIRQEQVHLPPT